MYFVTHKNVVSKPKKSDSNSINSAPNKKKKTNEDVTKEMSYYLLPAKGKKIK